MHLYIYIYIYLHPVLYGLFDFNSLDGMHPMVDNVLIPESLSKRTRTKQGIGIVVLLVREFLPLFMDLDVVVCFAKNGLIS